MSTDTPALFLRRREERRLRQGHPWVFSNEVDMQRSPLTSLEPGQVVDVFSHADAFLGVAYVNPHSLICARVFACTRGVGLDRVLLDSRVRSALSLRQRLYQQPFYRLIYGESDDLPGLVVDRYDDVLVVQIGTAGMERVCESVCEVLQANTGCTRIVLRNDLPGRELEGLPGYVRMAFGEPPEMLRVEENGARFEVPAITGQKTGWFHDHRANRARLAAFSRGARVLDLFSYAGGFGVQAALGGAGEVLCVDASAPALEAVTANAARNGVGTKVTVLQGDAFDLLKSLRGEGRRFDVVVLDPPAFIRRRKDMDGGQEAYRRVNRLAMQVLDADGILLSASCSAHLRRDRLLELVVAAARPVGRRVRVLEQGHQGADHPVHPSLPESDYLKAFFCRVQQ